MVLYFVSSNIGITEKTIGKINKGNVGEDVKLLGRVNRFVESEKVYFIEMTQPASMTVIVFKGDKQNFSLDEGDYVEIIGEIDEYEGRLEVIGNRIRVID